MNANDLIKIVVGVVIGVLLLSALVGPAINSGLIRETHTQENGSFTYYATNEMDGQVYSISDGKLAYNGEVLGNTAVHIISDKFRVMYYNGTMTMFDSTMTINPAVKTLTINSDGSYTVVTTADATIASTENLEWFAGPSTQADANYVESLMTSITGKIDPTSVIYGAFYGSVSDGNNTYGNTANIISIKGTVNKLQTTGYIRPSGDPWTELDSNSEITITYDDETQTYSTTGMAVLVNVGEYTTTTASNAFSTYIPIKYAEVADDPVNDMLEIIPLLIIIGIVVSIAAVFVSRRE